MATTPKKSAAKTAATSNEASLNQSSRIQSLEDFKDGLAKILIASDVAARGIDVAGLSHVFNFDVPINPEDYVHRIGRTGRAGLKGKASNQHIMRKHDK